MWLIPYDGGGWSLSTQSVVYTDADISCMSSTGAPVPWMEFNIPLNSRGVTKIQLYKKYIQIIEDK